MLLLYAVVLGLVAGLLTGGKLAALGSAHIRLWPVALIGLFAQLLLFSSPLAAVVGPWGPSLYVVSTVAVLMALVVNLRQPGFWLIIIGALANFAVIVANGGQMPASPTPGRRSTVLPPCRRRDFSNSVLAGPDTALAFLGDNFVLPRPLPLANVFSIGDVLIGAGGALFIVPADAWPRSPAPASTGVARPRSRRGASRRGSRRAWLRPSADELAAVLDELCQAVAADGGAALYLDDGEGRSSSSRSAGAGGARPPSCSTSSAARPTTSAAWC